jgi:hypothetical protein
MSTEKERCYILKFVPDAITTQTILERSDLVFEDSEAFTSFCTFLTTRSSIHMNNADVISYKNW